MADKIKKASVYDKPPRLFSDDKIPKLPSGWKDEECLSAKQWDKVGEWLFHSSALNGLSPTALAELARISRTKAKPRVLDKFPLAGKKCNIKVIEEAARVYGYEFGDFHKWWDRFDDD